MLLPLGVLLLLCCGALCLPVPFPSPSGRGCPVTSLLLETLSVVGTLQSQNKMMEEGGNITTYLEGFIKALKSSKEGSKERLIAQNLQRLQEASKSCPGWKELEWEPVEDEDFFRNLEYLLRFLNHNIPLEEATENVVLKEA